jgi:hypothetical protein
MPQHTVPLETSGKKSLSRSRGPPRRIILATYTFAIECSCAAGDLGCIVPIRQSVRPIENPTRLCSMAKGLPMASCNSRQARKGIQLRLADINKSVMKHMDVSLCKCILDNALLPKPNTRNTHNSAQSSCATRSLGNLSYVSG